MLVCACRFWTPGELLGRRQTRGGGGGVQISFCWVQEPQLFVLCLPLCCCTCLLFILRSEKEESGWWEKPTSSPLWGCSCVLPNCLMKGTFVLQWNISPFTSSWCGLPSFFIFRETLNLSARLADFVPWRLTENLNCRRAIVIKWEGWSKRLKI